MKFSQALNRELELPNLKRIEHKAQLKAYQRQIKHVKSSNSPEKADSLKELEALNNIGDK